MKRTLASIVGSISLGLVAITPLYAQDDMGGYIGLPTQKQGRYIDEYEYKLQNTNLIKPNTATPNVITYDLDEDGIGDWVEARIDLLNGDKIIQYRWKDAFIWEQTEGMDKYGTKIREKRVEREWIEGAKIKSYWKHSDFGRHELVKNSLIMGSSVILPDDTSIGEMELGLNGYIDHRNIYINKQNIGITLEDDNADGIIDRREIRYEMDGILIEKEDNNGDSIIDRVILFGKDSKGDYIRKCDNNADGIIDECSDY